MESDSHSQNKRSKKRKTAPTGLLGRLVSSSFFQFLLGNAAIFGTAKNVEPIVDDAPHAQQTFTALAIDVVLFAVLVLVAPLYTVCKFCVWFVREYWWVKFVLGIITGLCCLGSVYLLIHLLFF